MRLRVGWREWVALPGLGLPAVKAKIDTGARTSALSAVDLEPFARPDGHLAIRFRVRPLQRRRDLVVACEADVVDRRRVTDSGGHPEIRWVVRTPLRLAALEWTIELTLTDREGMRFPMLLGRAAMRQRLVVRPDSSYLCGRVPPGAYPGAPPPRRTKDGR